MGEKLSTKYILKMLKLILKKNKICPRRLGDVGNMYANIDKAKEDLRFSPKRVKINYNRQIIFK